MSFVSLPVPNVQDLASKKLKEIPDRYIQRELESEHVSHEISDEIPVIDLQKLFSNSDDGDEEMGKLHIACKDWGFFQLINHGVEDLIKKILNNVEEFFRLPLEEKKAYAQQPGESQGYGQAFVMSEDQKLDWSDILSLNTLPISERNMRVWPKNPTSFRETLEKYVMEMEKLTFKLLSLMAKNLGVEEKKLTSIFEDGLQGVRSNYYPPCPEADKVIGISPHSDASIITLLIQNNEVPGLQIRKCGNWVPIKPIQGAFIVNVGDVLEILSNGLYKSIEHRAIIHPERERISIAGFQDPRIGIVIGPLADLLDDKNVANYKSTRFADYLGQYFSAKLDGKSMLNLMKLENHA